jgi:hypothetical protein
VFEPYKTSELLIILAKMCDNKGQRVTEEATAACAEMINTVCGVCEHANLLCVRLCIYVCVIIVIIIITIIIPLVGPVSNETGAEWRVDVQLASPLLH